MSNPETERLISTAFHIMRSESKKARRKGDPEFDAQRRAVQRLQAKDADRCSIYPPGWDGEEWKPWGKGGSADTEATPASAQTDPFGEG